MPWDWDRLTVMQAERFVYAVDKRVADLNKDN